MKRFMIVALVGLGVAGVWSLTMGWTHDGHASPQGHSSLRANGEEFSGRIFLPPCTGSFDCRDGRCPIGSRFRGAGRDIPQMRKQAPGVPPQRTTLDLRTLAFRFEYATEIAAQEVAFELPRTRFTADLLDAADDLQQQARQFRLSVDRGAAPAHLQKHFQQMQKSFDTVVLPVQDMRRVRFIDRAFWRADGLLQQIATRLRSDQTEAPRLRSEQPVAPRLTPQPPIPQVTKPKQPVIPSNMKGIALLPVEQQAAALSQKTCPVTGGLLGGHGKPLAVSIKGKTIFVCCQGCIEDLKQNPEKSLNSL